MSDADEALPELSRALGRAEWFNWLLDRAACTNFIVAAEIEGELSQDRLQEALDAMQRAFPMLRARIAVDEAGVAVFRPAGDAPIAVHIRDEGSVDGWLPLVEREQDDAFALDARPLARAFLFRGSKAQVLVLSFNHAIADARSAAEMMLTVLKICGGEAATSLAPREPPTALEELYPPQYRGLRAAWRILLVLGRMALDVLRYGYPRRIVEPGVEPAPRQTRTLAMQVDGDALIARCRAERTTVQGAVMGAQVRAIRNEFGSRLAGPLSVTSAIDLRRHLTAPPDASELGYYVTVIPTVHRVLETSDLWDLAREARDQLVTRLERGEGHLMWWMLPGPWICRSDASGAERMSAFMKSGPQTSFVSNIGRVAGGDRIGQLRLRWLRFAIAPPVNALMTTAVSSVADRTFLTFTFDGSRTPEARRQSIATRITDALSL